MMTEKKEGTVDYKQTVMYSDVFSCKWFDEAIVRDVVNSFFSPEEITEQIILRS